MNSVSVFQGRLSKTKIERVSRLRRMDFWESPQGWYICSLAGHKLVSSVGAASSGGRAGYAAPTELGFSFRGGFYKYAAPLALEWVLNAV
jgi:hypothetical protein